MTIAELIHRLVKLTTEGKADADTEVAILDGGVDPRAINFGPRTMVLQLDHRDDTDCPELESDQGNVIVVIGYGYY